MSTCITQGHRYTLSPIPFSDSSFPLTSGRQPRESGNKHFETTKEITEFCPSGFTAPVAHAWIGCSQSSRFRSLVKGNEDSGYGNEIALPPVLVTASYMRSMRILASQLHEDRAENRNTFRMKDSWVSWLRNKISVCVQVWNCGVQEICLSTLTGRPFAKVWSLSGLPMSYLRKTPSTLFMFSKIPPF